MDKPKRANPGSPRVETEATSANQCVEIAGAHVFGIEHLSEWTPLWSVSHPDIDRRGTFHALAAHCLAVAQAAEAYGAAGRNIQYILCLHADDRVEIHCGPGSRLVFRLADLPGMTFTLFDHTSTGITPRPVPSSSVSVSPTKRQDAHKSLDQWRPGLLEKLERIWMYSFRRGYCRLRGRPHNAFATQTELELEQVRAGPLKFDSPAGTLTLTGVKLVSTQVRLSDDLIAFLRSFAPQSPGARMRQESRVPLAPYAIAWAAASSIDQFLALSEEEFALANNPQSMGLYALAFDDEQALIWNTGFKEVLRVLRSHANLESKAESQSGDIVELDTDFWLRAKAWIEENGSVLVRVSELGIPVEKYLATRITLDREALEQALPKGFITPVFAADGALPAKDKAQSEGRATPYPKTLNAIRVGLSKGRLTEIYICEAYGGAARTQVPKYDDIVSELSAFLKAHRKEARSGNGYASVSKSTVERVIKEMRRKAAAGDRQK